MDIRNCPDCGEDTMSAGLALWPDVDGPVEVVRCSSDDCEWAGVDESLEIVVVHRHSLAA